MANDSTKKLDVIAQAIYDKKGFNILALDVRDFSSLTDYYVIAEGNIDRHLQSIAYFIKAQLREMGARVMHIEGVNEGGWVVLDCGDVFVHLLNSEIREKYSLEELWQKSKIVSVKIDVSPNRRLEEK